MEITLFIIISWLNAIAQGWDQGDIISTCEEVLKNMYAILLRGYMGMHEVVSAEKL